MLPDRAKRRIQEFQKVPHLPSTWDHAVSYLDTNQQQIIQNTAWPSQKWQLEAFSEMVPVWAHHSGEQRILVSVLLARDTATQNCVRKHCSSNMLQWPSYFHRHFSSKTESSFVAWMLFIRWVTFHYMFSSVKIQAVYLPLAYQVNSDQSVSVSFSFYNSQVSFPFCTQLICSLC